MIECLVIVLASYCVLMGGWFWLNRKSGLTRRTIDEVGPFLRDANREVLLASLDSDQDDFLQSKARIGNYRRDQRVRLAHLRDCLAFMIRNALILFDWADTERYERQQHRIKHDPDQMIKIRNVMRTTSTFLRVARIAYGIIWVLGLLRFEEVDLMPLPRLSWFRRLLGVDLLAAYIDAARAGEALALANRDTHETVAKIRTCMWLD
jgi:hypothetical protein